eukprot:3558-Heterococcus_DN1.PRE.2
MATYLADRVVVYDGEPGIETTAHSPQSLLTEALIVLTHVCVGVARHCCLATAAVVVIDIYSLSTSYFAMNMASQCYATASLPLLCQSLVMSMF